MASLAAPVVERKHAALNVAVTAASAKSLKTRVELAREVGVCDRQLRRMIKSGTMNPEQCRLILLALGVPPTWALLLAEIGHPELIGTDEQDFLATFVPELVSLLADRPRSLNAGWAPQAARFIDEKLFNLGRLSEQRLMDALLS